MVGWRGLVEGIFPAMHGNADFRFPLASYFLDDVQRGSMLIGFSCAKREEERKMVRIFFFFYAYILLKISAIFSSADFTQFTRDYSLVVNSAATFPTTCFIFKYIVQYISSLYKYNHSFFSISALILLFLYSEWWEESTYINQII